MASSIGSKDRGRRKDALFQRDGANCCWCGRRLTRKRGWKNTATFEHMVPKALGGANSLANLKLACAECNNKRGDTGMMQRGVEA